MRTAPRPLVAILLCGLLGLQAVAASLTISKPEDVGFSSERLRSIEPLIKSHIASKDVSRAVTLVVRRG